MKLKTKIYLFQLLFSAIVLTFIVVTYKTYEKSYTDDITEYLHEKADFYKQQLLTSYYQATNSFDKKRELFYQVHKYALTVLQHNPNKPLPQLQKELQEIFHLQNIEVDLYLIDQNYTIFKTTFPRDLGFNLSIIQEAKEYLDATTQDKKIYLADFISTDSLNMDYKLYSYAYLKKGVYLELGFKDKTLSNNFKEIIQQLQKSNTFVEIFNINTNNNTYIYYKFSPHRTEAKEDFFKSITKAPHNDKKDPIVRAYREKRVIITYNKSNATLYIPLFQESMYKKIGFENIILKITISIAKKQATLQKLHTIFYSSIVIILFFLLLLYLFIDRYFTSAIEKIISSINTKTKVHDPAILTRNDEIAIIAKEYNALIASLNTEIVTNKKLLEENRRFIADTVHQIRTPLTNIMMNSEMIKRSDPSCKSANFVDQINASINMLTNAYEDLSYTITYDTIEYTPSLLCLSTVLEDRIKFFTTISKVNFKEIQASIQKEIMITINQIELERVIDNNIANALKYGNTNKAVLITLSETNNQILLEFKTFAQPIKNPQKIFDKNYREDHSKRGLGLGLNMVKKICQKYNISYGVSYKDHYNIFTYIFKRTKESK